MDVESRGGEVENEREREGEGERGKRNEIKTYFEKLGRKEGKEEDRKGGRGKEQ